MRVECHIHDRELTRDGDLAVSRCPVDGCRVQVEDETLARLFPDGGARRVRVLAPLTASAAPRRGDALAEMRRQLPVDGQQPWDDPAADVIGDLRAAWRAGGMPPV